MCGPIVQKYASGLRNLEPRTEIYMKGARNNKVLYIRAPEHTRLAVAIVAKRLGLSVNDYVNKVLELALKGGG